MVIVCRTGSQTEFHITRTIGTDTFQVTNDFVTTAGCSGSPQATYYINGHVDRVRNHSSRKGVCAWGGGGGDGRINKFTISRCSGISMYSKRGSDSCAKIITFLVCCSFPRGSKHSLLESYFRLSCQKLFQVIIW